MFGYFRLRDLAGLAVSIVRGVFQYGLLHWGQFRGSIFGSFGCQS